jgi:hypothetical protein
LIKSKINKVHLNHLKIIALKRYFVSLLFGLLLFPVVIFAKDETDSSGLSSQSFLYKDYQGYTNYIGLAPYPKNQTANYIGKQSNNEANGKKQFFKNMRYSGYARFYPMYRNMTSHYDIPASYANGLTVPVNLTADDGYQQPLMLFRFEGNPTPKSTFQMELQFDDLLNRTNPINGNKDTTGKLANLYIIFQLQAAVQTKIGYMKIIAGGGINWYRLSPSTLWQYQFRDDLFDRYPWEPEGHDFARYNSAYSSGDIPRDQRFGRQATQGFILEGTQMPLGFDAVAIYGKASTSGGFQSYLTQNNMNMAAGRIGKTIGTHKIGFNYFNQFGYTSNQIDYKRVANRSGDSVYVKDNYNSQEVASVDGRFDFDKFSIFTELGAGSYLSSSYNEGVKKNAKAGVSNASTYKRRWDETLFMELTTKKGFTIIPLKIAAYRIGANVVNTNSAVYNTSVEQALPNTAVPQNYNITYYDGMVTDIGQLANNRQGINLTASKKVSKLVVKFQMGMSQEIQNLAGDTRNGARGTYNGATTQGLAPYTNSITYEHRLNALSRSRFAFSQRFTGPYGRIQSIYRRTYDNITITDTDVNYKKSFNSADLELKYKFQLFGKELIVTNFNIYNSVQDVLSPIPVFSSKAFIRTFYEEFMMFYALHPKVTLVEFFGMERDLGNKRTELADASGKLITNANGAPIASPNGKAVNQTGYGFGTGFDYNFHTRASLNLRYRHYSYSDKNFTLDKFSGNEITTEFKVFF